MWRTRQMWRTRPTRGWGASIRLPDSPISYRSSLAARRSGSGHGDRDGAARDLLARGVRLLAGGGRHRDVHGEHLTGHQLRMRLDGEDDLLIALHRQPDTVRDIQTGGTAGRLDHPDHVTSDALALQLRRHPGVEHEEVATAQHPHGATLHRSGLTGHQVQRVLPRDQLDAAGGDG